MHRFQALIYTSILMASSLSLHAEELKLTTWNLEWLAIHSNHNIKESRRNAEDFTALSEYFRKIDADVFAIQEIDSKAALQRISSPDYTVVLSDRNAPQHSSHQFSDINQYTGFAIHNSIPFTDPNDIDLYGKTGHKLRFAAYIILYPDSKQPVHALSLHLKAGCMGKFYSNKRNCQTLLEQGKSLNKWISEREKLGQQYVITGDFNHNLSYNGDWLWETFTRGLNNKPVLATKNTKAKCQVRKRNDPKQLHQFRSLIDHIIISPGIKGSQTQQTLFKQQDVLNYHLSDHCPVSSTLSWN